MQYFRTITHRKPPVRRGRLTYHVYIHPSSIVMVIIKFILYAFLSTYIHAPP